MSTDALLRQEPEEEEDEDEEDNDADDDDNDDDEEEDDGYSACPCLLGEGSRFESLTVDFRLQPSRHYEPRVPGLSRRCPDCWNRSSYCRPAAGSARAYP